MHARPIAIGLHVLEDAPLGLALAPWLLPSTDSPFSVSENGSASALSGGVPGLDADWAVPCEPRHRRKEREAHRAPWPPWETRPPSSGGPSLPTACSIASIATFSVMRPDIDQPTTLREKAPVAAAK